ncbi:hypothetical protein SFRURICE_009248 [Spodoptera frugiperda]|nr:hypothetical protein SFRURICE_009248 [Spodoptera frugiperda]
MVIRSLRHINQYYTPDTSYLFIYNHTNIVITNAYFFLKRTTHLLSLKLKNCRYFNAHLQNSCHRLFLKYLTKKNNLSQIYLLFLTFDRLLRLSWYSYLQF